MADATANYGVGYSLGMDYQKLPKQRIYADGELVDADWPQGASLLCGFGGWICDIACGG